MNRFPAGFVVLICSAALGWSAESVLTVRVVPPASGFTAGEAGILSLELLIKEPFHINSNRPLESYLIPTTVQFEERPGVTFGAVSFPQAPVKKLPVSDNPMSVYEGAITLTAEVRPDPTFAGKEITIQGHVRYQACNDRVCLPPARAPFEAVVSVARGRVSSTPLPSPAAPPAAASSSPRSSPAPPVETDKQTPIGTAFAERGVLWTLLLVFVGGLALNLTPCVYPMIPITMAYFGRQAGGRKGALLLHAVLYVVGIAITYSILGTAAALTGSLFGSALQYPLVLVGIAGVMVLLALSMFEVYDLRMPAFLNRLAGRPHNGLFGTLVMGLTVGIVAAPCIGPFVVGLLTYVGNSGDALLGFALFFVLALGMGVPFVLLALFSGSLSRLPRSGAWMVWVRTVFGFVLIGMAIYFLRPLFRDELSYSLTFALAMLLAGIYTAWIDPVRANGKTFVFMRNGVGLVFFAVAIYLAATGIRVHMVDTVRNQLQALSAAGNLANVGIQWFPYSDAKLDEAIREGKPVFIDFYADWCLPCKELDQQTFSAPEVISASRRFVMLKADLTSGDDPTAARLQQRYETKGVPTLVFLKPDGTEITELRVVGFEPKDVFLPKMKRALDMSGAATVSSR